MKSAAILCPGPSLAGMLGRPFRQEYDLLIGVNRAVEAFECDYWVALDVRTFGMTSPLGTPILVASRRHYKRVTHEWPEARRFQHLDHHSLKVPQLTSTWTTKGLLTAIVLAFTRDAQVIDCYGVDWAGVQDFDGKTFPKQIRTPKRWEKEAQQFEQLRTALGERGVMVQRVRRV